MVLKTFNLDFEVHKQFAEYCKKEGISMSKKIENFLRQELEKINSPTQPKVEVKNNDLMRKYTH